MSYYSDDLSQIILKSNHALISGASGSGKSTLIDTLLYNLCGGFHPSSARFCVIDLKKISLIHWKDSKHLLKYASDQEQAESLIADLVNLMMSRYSEMEKTKQTNYNGTKIYLIVDEAADLLDSCPSAKANLVKLMRLGRSSAICVIYATQDPSKKTIFAQAQQNVEALVGLRCRDSVASRQIIGAKGCEKLPRYGQALVYTPSLMEITPFKVFYTEEKEIERVKREI